MASLSFLKGSDVKCTASTYSLLTYLQSVLQAA
jgi:hypothetical protein